MSHLNERKEKVCLNCNANIHGKYCHICGQENIEPKESVWHLVKHFFNDITHFDGKFFSTLNLLIFRPGYLSRQYVLGRRASYLNPIRMYIFSSAFFFLIFFNFFQGGNKVMLTGATHNGVTLEEVDRMDSASFAKYTTEINREDKRAAVPMTRKQFANYIDSQLSKSGIHFTNAKYATKEAYDSALSSGKKKHNWWQRAMIYKEIELNQKYHNNAMLALSAIKDSILHSLPQMLFISLPLLALLLKLFYVRRKEFYYVSHGIFSIHLYIFIFISLLVILSLGKLNEWLNWDLISYIKIALIVGVFFYTYKALRNFYQQGRAKTLLKYVLLLLAFSFLVLFLFVFFAIFSIFKI